MNHDWNKDRLRAMKHTPYRPGLSYMPEKSEYCTVELKNRNRARIELEDRAIASSVAVSDNEYYERMARELENDNLEGVA